MSIQYAPLADPDGSGALIAAVSWVQDTLLGTVATTVAVIAVASVGFLMLSGRVDVRRGITVVTGCFILFGASSIVGGITFGTGSDLGVDQTYVAPLPSAPPSPAARVAVPYDPYAGASVPPL